MAKKDKPCNHKDARQYTYIKTICDVCGLVSEDWVEIDQEKKVKINQFRKDCKHKNGIIENDDGRFCDTCGEMISSKHSHNG